MLTTARDPDSSHAQQVGHREIRHGDVERFGADVIDGVVVQALKRVQGTDLFPAGSARLRELLDDMNKAKSLMIVCAWLVGTATSGTANAWFVILPFGAIARALEVEPDSITVSSQDRALGKCAGLHVNQTRKYMSPAVVSAGSDPLSGGGSQGSQTVESPVGSFHRKMADEAVAKASEKDKVRQLADAYSVKWGRAAGVDQQANRAYGADLASACAQSGIAVSFPAWQSQEAAKQKQLEDDERKRLKAEEDAKRVTPSESARSTPTSTLAHGSSPSTTVDYSTEAGKAARILGCNTADTRVMGVEGQSIIFRADCGGGQFLTLVCDQSGLCLKKNN